MDNQTPRAKSGKKGTYIVAMVRTRLKLISTSQMSFSSYDHKTNPMQMTGSTSSTVWTAGYIPLSHISSSAFPASVKVLLFRRACFTAHLSNKKSHLNPRPLIRLKQSPSEDPVTAEHSPGEALVAVQVDVPWPRPRYRRIEVGGFSKAEYEDIAPFFGWNPA